MPGRPGWPYLEGMLTRRTRDPFKRKCGAGRRPPGGVAFGIIVGSAVLAAAMLLGAAVLWIHYGTAVFFEMIASGIAACF